MITSAAILSFDYIFLALACINTFILTLLFSHIKIKGKKPIAESIKNVGKDKSSNITAVLTVLAMFSVGFISAYYMYGKIIYIREGYDTVGYTQESLNG